MPKRHDFLPVLDWGVFETGSGMVRRMELFLGSHSVAVSGQPRMEVTVRFGVLGGRRQISTSVGVGTQVNALTDGSLQVMYHPGRKGFVFKEPVFAMCGKARLPVSHTRP